MSTLSKLCMLFFTHFLCVFSELNLYEDIEPSSLSLVNTTHHPLRQGQNTGQYNVSVAFDSLTGQPYANFIVG